MLESTRLQRVKRDLVTKQQQTIIIKKKKIAWNVFIDIIRRDKAEDDQKGRGITEQYKPVR